VCKESNDPPETLCNRPYCVLITTGSNKGDSGRLNVFIDKGHGYVPVTMAGKSHGQYYAESEIVLDQCFPSLVGIQINDPSNNNRIRDVLLSTDGKNSYVPFLCDDCNGETSLTNPIAVDGNDDGGSQYAANCLNGASCTLLVSLQLLQPAKACFIDCVYYACIFAV